MKESDIRRAQTNPDILIWKIASREGETRAEFIPTEVGIPLQQDV